MVGRILGEGGFGITYVGYDLNLDMKVAIKEFYPSGFVSRSSTHSTTVQPHSGDQGDIFIKGRERFVDEAKRLAKFRVFTGIVMVNDFFVENGTAYIVMEYVDGQTLKNYIGQMGGKLPPEQVLEMLRPIFSSLAQVHENGIIHRDISPDNIMMTRDGTVKLLDFGAAREFEDDTNKSLSVLLKHGYAPAEQYSTKGIQGPHTDVYALSATIYKAITGVTPESSMDRVMDDTLVPPSRLGITMLDYQEAALMKGLAIRQQDRYQSVKDLYTALGKTNETKEDNPRGGENLHGRESSSVLWTKEENPRGGDNPRGGENPRGRDNPRGGKGSQNPIGKSKRGKIIGAIVAACLVIAIIFALTLPGTPIVPDTPTVPDAPIIPGAPSNSLPPDLSTIEGIQEHLLNKALLATTIVTTDELDLFHTIEDTNRPEWEQIRRRLQQFADEHDLVFVYFWRPFGDGYIQYIIDNDDDEDWIITPDWIFHVDDDPVTASAFSKIMAGETWVSSGTTPTWDGLLSGLAPIFNADGSVYGAAGVDIWDEDYFSAPDAGNDLDNNAASLDDLMPIFLTEYISEEFRELILRDVEYRWIKDIVLDAENSYSILWQSYEAGSFYDLSILLDTYGTTLSERLIFTSRWYPPDDYIPEERPWYIMAVEANGDVAVSEPYIATDTGITHITFSQAIFDDDGNRIAILCITFAYP
jgi:serine/threonine protein kinase